MKRLFSYSIALAFLILAFLWACQPKIDIKAETNALLELDREFSRKSKELGASKAFLHYIDDNAVLLRPNRSPIVGKDNIIEIYSRPDTGFILTWEPSYAMVSKSGDLGYTYGTYKMESFLQEGEPEINRGTYVTIWHKNEEGKWKFVMDTGNPGLERKKPNLD